jgi:hypothetical protein
VIIIWFFVANSVIEDPERMSLFEMVLRFFDRRIKKNRDAIGGTEDTDRALLMKKGLNRFRACGYPEKLYRNSTVDSNGRVCFICPGEAIFCYCSVTNKIIETRL